MPVIHSPVDDARFVQLEDVIVEEFGELLPNLGVSILSEALIVESIPKN